MLTSKQRSYLKALANEIDASVYIGKEGLTDNILKSIDEYLDAHELIKVNILEGAWLDPKETANEAAGILKAEFVQAIGRKFVLYRENHKERKIILPRK